MTLGREIEERIEAAVAPYGYYIVGSPGSPEAMDELCYILDCDVYDYPREVAAQSAIAGAFPNMRYKNKSIVFEWYGISLEAVARQ